MEVKAGYPYIEANTPETPLEKTSFIKEKIQKVKEKMEIESHIFIDATKQFTTEWIRREMETDSSPCTDNQSSHENPKFDSGKLRETKSDLKSDLKELSIKIPYIVEANLNQDDYWIHRNSLVIADFSQDYFEFKKEKMKRELTSSIRMILGCASEILGDMKEDYEDKYENKIWVKERGRRKYVCFFRFSDEMTTSLDRYFEELEEFLILNHEMKKEIERIDGRES